MCRRSKTPYIAFGAVPRSTEGHSTNVRQEEWKKHAWEPWRILFPDLDWHLRTAIYVRRAKHFRGWHPMLLNAMTEYSDLPFGKMIPVSEINVWQAAAQMVKLFDIDASLEADLRSDAALDAGDMDNHRLWLSVMRAVDELQRTKRMEGEGLN